MVRVVLRPVLDIQQAAPLQAELLGLRGHAVEVDGTAVERLGGLCLQVLLAARQTWDADGAAFDLVSPSAALVDQWNSFGAPALAAGRGDVA